MSWLNGYRWEKFQFLSLWIVCLFGCHEIDGSGLKSKQSQVYIIREIKPQGITLKKPGTYLFKHKLKWDPNSDGAAITIKANNVTLNMNGRTLQSSLSNYKTKGILAIGCENLQIQNGKLKNFGLCGIECDQCIDVSVKKVEVDGLNVHDTLNYTVPTGILANECINVSIDKCAIKNFSVKTGSSAAIQLTKTLFSEVTNCYISHLLNEDGACTGIGHLLCDEALVESCKIDQLQSKFIDNLNTEGHTAIGIVPVLTTNLEINRCTISNITGCCDDAHGMSIFICDQAVVKKCKVINVLDGAGEAQAGAKATGIEVYASDVVVRDCSVKNITAINPEDKQATGFSAALCKGVIFIHCKAEKVKVFDENGNTNALLGYGTGFGWAPDPRPEFVFPAENVSYQYCEAKDCQVGFDAWYHIDSVWYHIVSKRNEIPILNQVPSQRTLSCGPCSECGCHLTGCYPTPLVVTLDNIAENNQFIHVKIK